MALWLKIVIIVLVVIIAVLAVLYILGTKMQKRQAQQQSVMEAMAQTVSMLVIDKKRLRFKDAGFPKVVYDQSPKYLRRAKVPVVKAKIGPRIMTLMCDDTAFEMLPLKKEVRAMVSGIYIMSVKSLRGPALTLPPKKKQGFVARLRSKALKAAGRK